MVIIERYRELLSIKKLRPPLIIYGRRKTGKTFFARRFFKEFSYFFVRRNRTIFSYEYEENIRYEELLREIRSGKKIMIDEFHRLPEDFLDFLHMESPENLVLITSTLHLFRDLVGKRSPILGLFLEYKFDIISPVDIIINLKPKNKEDFERCVFLREPILLRFYDLEILEIIKHLRLTVPSLVGEIFLEEDRKLTGRYEGVIRAVSVGRSKITEITDYLYSSRLIDKREDGLLRQYIKNLMDIGLIRRYKDFYKKTYYYFLHSPMISLYYYLDEKYEFSERDIKENYLLERVPFYLEDFFRELLSEIFGLKPCIVNLPDIQIDGVFLEFQKPKVVMEVKWKEKVKKDEISKIERKFSRFKDCRKILIVPYEDSIRFQTSLEVWDIERVLMEAKSVYNIPSMAKSGSLPNVG